MPTYSDRAVIVRGHDIGEADRIVTMISQQRGRLRAVARGVRRTSSKFGGRLEPASHVALQIAQGRTLDVVTQVETIHSFGKRLGGDYQRFTSAHVILESADRLLPVDGEPAPGLYRLLLGALATLENGTPLGPRPAAMISDAFLLRALAWAGYAPSLTACAVCDEPGAQPYFAPAGGGAVCLRCRPAGAASLDPVTQAYLLALAGGDWAATADVPEAVAKRAGGMIAAFTSWHTEQGLRSLSYLERG